MYASHYTLLPGAGYVRQQVVALTPEGVVDRVFPLTGEIEGVEWRPGIIALLPESGSDEEYVRGCFDAPVIPAEEASGRVADWLVDVHAKGQATRASLYYPFDFTAMRPVGGTRRIPLR